MLLSRSRRTALCNRHLRLHLLGGQRRTLRLLAQLVPPERRVLPLLRLVLDVPIRRGALARSAIRSIRHQYLPLRLFLSLNGSHRRSLILDACALSTSLIICHLLLHLLVLLYRLRCEYHINLFDVRGRHGGHGHLVRQCCRILLLRLHGLCVVPLIPHI